MNTRILMASSSVVLGVAGLAGSFGPTELLESLGIAVMEPLPVLIQLLGALYIGFALTNWTAKDNVIGGVYSRAITIGNAVHFVAGALALAKQQSVHGLSALLMAVLVTYVIFAGCFIWLVFGTTPAPRDR